MSRGTLPPSLIFAGPRGTGKRATALAVAQALNCLDALTDPADQAGGAGQAPGTGDSAESEPSLSQCRSCVRIARGVHPDVIIVGPGESGAIKIDQVRDLVDRSAYRPFEGRRRVVIVEDADAMVPGAQNALLKTLEEPPPSSVFILLTSRPDTLFATLRSRCIQLTFAEGAPAEVDAGERKIAERVLVQAASGSDGKRLESAKDLLIGTGAGGASDRAQVAAHLQAVASLLRDIQVIASRAGAAAGTTGPASQGASSDAAGESIIDRLVRSYQGERGVYAYAAVERALAALEKNAGVKIVADWLAVQL